MLLSDLTPDPKNARLHDERNLNMITKSLEEFGPHRSGVIDEGGRILAGNGTWRAMQQAGIEKVRVVPAQADEWVVVQRVGLSEEEKRRLALLDNRAGELAEWDDEVLKALVEDGTAEGLWSDEELEALLDDLPPDGQGNEEGGHFDEAGAEGEEGVDGVPNLIFASDNEWDIPTLDIKRQARGLSELVEKWGDRARTTRHEGIYHFYTDDYKFQALWDDPRPVIASGCQAVFEPNFSTHADMPMAVGLARIYQKRWLSRYWQEVGIKIFVDLCVDPKFYELNLLGVPSGWQAFCTRGYSHEVHLLDEEYQQAKAIAGQEPLFVVYGGGRKVVELCRQRGWLHLRENMHVKEGRR